MAGFNNNKFVSSTPKTYEVKYVENKSSGLSPVVRSKVINRSGSNYLSSRATIINPSYGPGFWDEVVEPVGKAIGRTVMSTAIVATGPVTAPFAAAASIAGGSAQKKLAEEGKDVIPEPVRKVIEFQGDNLVNGGKDVLNTLTFGKIKDTDK